MTQASTSTRLRQAILANDVSLVERLLKASPHLLHNPDFSDKSNTSLHLAARAGFTELVELLISLGHDRTVEVTDYIYSNAGNNQGISLNTDNQCALHVAAAHQHADVIEVLCKEFPTTINRADKQGRTPLLLASGSATSSTRYSGGVKVLTYATEDVEAIEALLRYGSLVTAQDNKGNTCLHNACAWGNLKAVRALVEAGADPKCANYAGWTPDAYSLTVQADVYYRTLVAEFEKQRLEDEARARERRKTGGRVRMISADDEDEIGSEHSGDRSGSRAGNRAGRFMPSRNTTANSGITGSGLGIEIDR